MKITLALGVLVLAGVAGAVTYFTAFAAPKVLRFPGIVEIQEVRLGSKIAGRVAKLFVREGESVQPGQVLLEFEVPELENMRDQLKARLAAVEAEYDRARAGPRAEEKEAAKAAAEAMRARVERLKKGYRDEEVLFINAEKKVAETEVERSIRELERIVQLMRDKSASKTDYDSAIAARDKAVAQLGAAKARADMYKSGSRKEDIAEAVAEWDRMLAKYSELMAGTRSEDIQLAYAKVQEARAKLEEVAINLREGQVKVPNLPEFKNAKVEVLPIRAGDIVPAGQPVARMLCLKDLWVKIYVPETQLGHLTLNAPVDIKIDTFPNKRFQGKVTQIASISEFTPRNVQSIDERRHQVFGIKVEVLDQTEIFHAGMAAEVTLRVE